MQLIMDTQEKKGLLRRRVARVLAAAGTSTSQFDELSNKRTLKRRRKQATTIRLDWGTVVFAAITLTLGLLSHYFGHRHGVGMIPDVLPRMSWRYRTTVENDTSTYRPKYGEEVLGYDIYNCPKTIPLGYPKTWDASELLGNWNPNDVTTIPPEQHREVYQGLCVFDYETQYDTAKIYRDADMPFVIRDDPRVSKVSRRWSDPNYLLERLSNQLMYTERSPTNHLMFYRIDPDTDTTGWTRPPNDFTMMSFEEWATLATLREARVLGSREIFDQAIELRDRYKIGTRKNKDEFDNVYTPEDDALPIEHDVDTYREKEKKWYYLRLNGWVEDVDSKRIDKFLFDELSFFDPRKEDEGSDFYLFPPEEQNGINCRFGMRGIVAEAHYDGARNMIALLEGERRYILGHPDQCKKMALHPFGHPSARHNSFDWSNMAEWDIHPEFKEAQLSEVVLQAGDVLFLPTSWFHYIINLSKNIQCNSSSGKNNENDHYIQDCGF